MKKQTKKKAKTKTLSKKKTRIKKHPNLKKIIKKIWNIFGIITFIWTLYWFVEVRILNHYELVRNVIMLTIGLTLLIFYSLITMIYWAIKRLKKEWEIKK